MWISITPEASIASTSCSSSSVRLQIPRWFSRKLHVFSTHKLMKSLFYPQDGWRYRHVLYSEGCSCRTEGCQAGAALFWWWKNHTCQRKNMEHPSIVSGELIATSHDLTPNGGLVREIPLFQGNLGWWNIITWPDCFNTFFVKDLQGVKLDTTLVSNGD